MIRVLLVEDEPMIAMMAEDMLDAVGCTVAGVAETVADAMAAVARGDFDMALLDVNLRGQSSMPVAQALKDAGCHFAFTTGYGADGIDGAHHDVAVLAKPYTLAQLEATVAACPRIQVAGTSSTTSISDSKRG